MQMNRERFAPALAIVAISAVMITMDNTAVNIIKLTIQQRLHTSDTALEWVNTGYILVFSCLMITGGRLVDMFGARACFATGMSLFTGASLLAGLSHDIATLIGARLLQGGGAALALPATLVVINVGRTDRQRSIGMIVWVGACAAASALGPGIGAVLSGLWGWQAVFLVNVGPGLLTIPLSLLYIGGTKENPATSLDLPGVLTSTALLFALTYGLAKHPDVSWTDPSVLSVFGLALVALVALVVVERWVPDPIFDISFFRNRVFSGAVAVQILVGFGFSGVIYYGATFMLNVLRFGQQEVALVLLPPAIAIGLLTPISFWLTARLGPRLTVSLGVCLLALGMLLFSTLRKGDGYMDLMPGVVTLGIGVALTMPLPMYVLKSVPEERNGVAGGIMNVGREMSGALGIALLGAIIYSIQASAEHSGVRDGNEAFRQGTQLGLPIGASVLMIGAVIAALTLPSRRTIEVARLQELTVIEHVVKPLPIPQPASSMMPVPTLSAPPPWPLPKPPVPASGPLGLYDPHDPLGIGPLDRVDELGRRR